MYWQGGATGSSAFDRRGMGRPLGLPTLKFLSRVYLFFKKSFFKNRINYRQYLKGTLFSSF